MANDDMDRVHREDMRAERDFRELERQIRTVLSEHGSHFSLQATRRIRLSGAYLSDAADAIVRRWD